MADFTEPIPLNLRPSAGTPSEKEKLGNVGPPPKGGKLLDTTTLVENVQQATDESEAALNIASLEGAENFVDNYYLIQILDEIKPLTDSTVYRGWTSLSQNESGRNPSYLKAYFEDWDQFTSMTTKQASLLQPYFNLSIVKRDKKNARWSEISAEHDVLLQGTYAGSANPESALSEQYNEPVLGLKDFSFKKEAHMDKGKRAATTATLQFFGNNLSIFQRSPYKEMLARANTKSGTSYGMKIVVGWALASRASDEHFSSKFKSAVKAARTVLYMQTVRNEFDFNQDGTFTVTLTCVGSTNDFIREFDLLGPIDGLKALVRASQAAQAAIANPNVTKQDGGTENLNTLDEKSLNDPAKRISTTESLDLRTIREETTEAARKAVEGEDSLTQEQKDKFVKDNVDKVMADATKSYNGDSPTYLNRAAVAERFGKLVTDELISAQKQRSQEKMSRIQFLLYKNKAIRYVKVGKSDFLASAGNTLGAIKGREKVVKATLQAIEQEMEYYRKLFGELKEDENGNVTVVKEGVELSDQIGNNFFMGIGSDADENDEQITFQSLVDPSKQVPLSEAMNERNIGYDISFSETAFGHLGGRGAVNEKNKQFKKNLKIQKQRLRELEASDPNSRESFELRLLINTAEKKQAETYAEYNDASMFTREEYGTDSQLYLKNQFMKQQLLFAQLEARKEQAARQLASIQSGMDDGTVPPSPTLKGVVEGSDQTAEGISQHGIPAIDPLNEENTKTHYIAYFFLGDLINVLYDMAELDGRSGAMPYILLGSMVYNANLVSASKEYTNVKQQQSGTFSRRMIEMAQIPISVKRFNAFFHKNYVQKLYNKVNLSTFLNDVFSTLIRPIFSGEAFGLRLRKPTFKHVNFDSGDMSLQSYQSVVNLQRANMSDLSPGLFYQPETSTQTKGYIMITSNLVHQANGNGNFARDFQLNIPHYYLGADRGVLKQANFIAVRNKYDEADRVTKASKPITDPQGPSDMGLKVLKTPYDVNLTTIGNPMLQPGSAFYLLPTIPGKGNAAAATELGLGGYYTTIHIEGHLSEGGTYETMAYARNTLNQFSGGTASNEGDKSSNSSEVDPKAKIGENN